MARPPQNFTHKVIIRRCPDYDNVDRIRGLVAEGMAELGAKPHGRVLLKYNLVFAHPRMGRSAFTNPSVLEAVIDAVGARPEVDKVILGERTGAYMPTRYAFRMSPFARLAQKPKVEVCFFDEDKKVEVELTKGVYHKKLKLARTIVEADYKIYAPKLKHHVSTKLTCALKLNIGICDQKERLDGHDWRLEEKIADLYEPGHPDFIVVDAIDAGQKNEIFPEPRRLGLLMMGTSSVAVDAIAARILGFSSGDIKHLRLARERGWEPVSDDQIELVSEVPWTEIEQKAKDWDCSFGDLDQIETPVRFFLGHHPGGTEPCWGGCINMLKGALAGFDANRPGCLKDARPLAVVVGEYEGDVDGQGLPVLLIGKCTKVKGKINGRVYRVPGCPVGIPIFTILAPIFLRIPSPILSESPVQALVFPYDIARAWLNRLKNRLIM